MIKIKNLFKGLLFIVYSQCISENIDPFSKIIITSDKAVCTKCESMKNVFSFKYIDNVVVTLSDGSKITSNTLEVTLNSSGFNVFEKDKQQTDTTIQNSTNKKSSVIKKIIFRTNVKISSQNRNATADSAEINLLNHTCRLEGNVKINQTKNKQSDIPINVQSNCAVINLKTSEMTLHGSSCEPVSTVIELTKDIWKKQ